LQDIWLGGAAALALKDVWRVPECYRGSIRSEVTLPFGDPLGREIRFCDEYAGLRVAPQKLSALSQSLFFRYQLTVAWIPASKSISGAQPSRRFAFSMFAQVCIMSDLLKGL